MPFSRHCVAHLTPFSTSIPLRSCLLSVPAFLGEVPSLGPSRWCLAEGIPAKGQSLCRLAPNSKLCAADTGVGLGFEAHLSSCQHGLGVVPQNHLNRMVQRDEEMGYPRCFLSLRPAAS